MTNPQVTKQQQPLHISPTPSPVTSAHPSPVPASDRVMLPDLSDNDLLGLNPASQPLTMSSADDDTAPSSSDETPVYTVEGDVPEDEDGIYSDEQVKPLIFGYLRKLGRNGKWQRRFFETDGESLSYYKSAKRSKQLAMLDLLKVGKINIGEEDTSGCTFHIQVADRPYSLRADNKHSCMDWVISLNRIKEARLQLGRVKLVPPKFKQSSPRDLLSPSGSTSFVAPRVVMDANRQRTRAVNDKDQWQTLMDDRGAVQQTAQPASVSYENNNMAVANWVKPRNTLYRVKQKIIKWARSIKHIAVSCAAPNAEQAVLDSHLHPPGHDDQQESVSTGSGGAEGVKRSTSHDKNDTANFRHGEEIRELA